MKAIKVIVDEMPKSCTKCNHCYDNTCEITFKRLTDIRFDSRPDWCPLALFTKESIYELYDRWAVDQLDKESEE